MFGNPNLGKRWFSMQLKRSTGVPIFIWTVCWQKIFSFSKNFTHLFLLTFYKSDAYSPPTIRALWWTETGDKQKMTQFHMWIFDRFAILLVLKELNISLEILEKTWHTDRILSSFFVLHQATKHIYCKYWVETFFCHVK